MKKEKLWKIVFFALIIVIIVLITILFVSQKPKNMTKNMYNDINEKNKYTFSMLEENEELKYNLKIVKNDESMCIDTTSNDERTSTLVKNGSAYYIMHTNKEYYLYDSSEIDADILGNELDVVKANKYKGGYETINAKRYYYEEYDDIVTFILLTNYNEESSIKTRFYYDDGKIAYIKTFVDDTEELLKIDFSDNVDESLFEIPEGYAELESE